MNPLMDVRMPHPVHDLLTDSIAPSSKGTKEMLIYEDLARERRRDAERYAKQARLVSAVNAVRRWERISAWAARRAQRAADRDLS
jgi:hypothetical protein